MKSKRLAVSVLKTNYILFHTKKLKPCKSFNLLIARVSIKQVPTVKYVGVTFDSNCSKYNNFDKLTLFCYSLIYLFVAHSICYISNLFKARHSPTKTNSFNDDIFRIPLIEISWYNLS